MTRHALERFSPTAVIALAALALATGCATATPPELVRWNVEQSNPYVMAGEATEQVINVDIAADLPPELQAHIPLNLSLVLDHSGSMNGEQMEDAREALKYMLSELHPDDKVSVIAFSTRVAVLLPQTEWDDVNRGELFDTIDELQPRGTTAMYEALNQGYQEVISQYDAAAINRIILLSDGIPNDATYLTSVAQNAKAANIGITTMGLGPYYNEDLMAQLADLSGGKYRFIKDSGEIREFFLAEKRAMEQVVARNVSLTFNLGPGVQVVQTLGAQGSFNGRQVTVHLGELSASDPRQIALKLNVTAPASGARVEIADARLAWEDVVAWSGNHEAWAYVEAESTKDQAVIDKHQNKLVVEKAGRLHAAWEMERAIRDYEAGRREDAQRRLQSAATEYNRQKQEAEAYKMRILETPAEFGGDSPTPQISGNVLNTPSSVGSDDLDIYLEAAAESLEEEEPESDEGKIIIKSIKSRSRHESGL